MDILFIIHPKEDACDTCKEIAYVNGEDDSEGYRIHVGSPSILSKQGIVHRNCRCEIEVIDETGEAVDEALLNRISEDVKDKVRIRKNSASAIPSRLFTTSLPVRGTTKQLINYHHRTKRNVGKSFFTVVSEQVTTIYNWVRSLFRGK